MQSFYSMSSSAQWGYLEHSLTLDQLKIKDQLYLILTTLQQESKTLTDSYKARIEVLEGELEEKEIQLHEVISKLETISQQHQVLEWKLIEKDNIIEDLKQKVAQAEASVVAKVRAFIDGIDSQNEGQMLTSTRYPKRKCINISDYFIHSKSNIKQETKRTKTGQNQNSSTEYSENKSRFIDLSVKPSLIKNNSDIDHSNEQPRKPNLKSDSDPTNVYLKVPTPPRLEKVKSFDEASMRKWDSAFLDELEPNTNSKSKKTTEQIALCYLGNETMELSSFSKHSRNSGGELIQMMKNRMESSSGNILESCSIPNQTSLWNPSPPSRFSQPVKKEPAEFRGKLEQKWKQMSAFDHNKILTFDLSSTHNESPSPNKGYFVQRRI